MTVRPDPVQLAEEFPAKREPQGCSATVSASHMPNRSNEQKSPSASNRFATDSDLMASGLWRLEKQPTLVAAPWPEVAPRIPSSWIDGVARLSHSRPPTDIPMHRWRQFLADCHQF